MHSVSTVITSYDRSHLVRPLHLTCKCLQRARETWKQQHRVARWCSQGEVWPNPQLYRIWVHSAHLSRIETSRHSNQARFGSRRNVPLLLLLWNAKPRIPKDRWDYVCLNDGWSYDISKMWSWMFQTSASHIASDYRASIENLVPKMSDQYKEQLLRLSACV